MNRRSDDHMAFGFLGVGLHFAVTFLLIAGGGYAVDRWLDTRPWFLLLGIFLGLATATWELLKQVQRLEKRKSPK